MAGIEPKGAVVVITGASSGIGRATAREFARRGAHVVLAARRREALEEVAAECRGGDHDTLVVPTDVVDGDGVEALASQAVERFGRIDVWVNNAAVSIYAHFEETPPEIFRRVVEVNLFGTVNGGRAALARFREQGRGVLINVGSLASKMGSPYYGAYAASKHAVLGWADSLRHEILDAPGIRVCTLLPAAIDTPFYQQVANRTGRVLKPLNPIHPPESVARAIVETARHPRDEAYVGGVGLPLSMVRRLSPRLFAQVYARQVEADHFKDEPAPPTDGNVFEPVPGVTGVTGGYRAAQARRLRRPLAALAAGAAATVAGVGLWARMRNGDRRGSS